MGRKAVGILFLSFIAYYLAFDPSFAQVVAEPVGGQIGESEGGGAPGSIERAIENRAFGVGERLEFSLGYGPIPAGTTVLSVVGIKSVREHQSYHIVSETRSNKLFSLFFKVRDRLESFVDVKGLFSWHFEKHLREGKYKADISVDYDQVNHLAISRRDTLRIPPYVQDILSAIYYVRTQELEVGKPLLVDYHDGKKVYPLEVRVLRKERVEVPAGGFSCFVVEPLLQGGGIFKHEDGFILWLTDDRRKLPVMMKTKLTIGSIVAKLERMNL